ncbi:MAG: hypothetical protein WBD22_10405 [Pyrinomonadaceae bacterium]
MERHRFERELEYLSGGTAAGLEFESPLASASLFLPPGLKKIDHLHMRKSPIPSAATPGSSLEKLNPEGMNPGFINDKDELIVDSTPGGLDGRAKEIVTKYMSAYKDETKVALVDLSGKKLFSPEYSGWKSTVLTVAASTAKILPIYAAFQLIFDLNQLAKSIKGEKAIIAEFKDRLRKAGIFEGPSFIAEHFTFDQNSAEPFAFSGSLKTHIRDIHASPSGANNAASRVIRAVGFGYMASVVAQSGLWHNRRKGLWLQGDYAGRGWGRSPVGGFSANCNALSLVSFFTLLAQERLVDQASSTGIKTALTGGSWMGSSIASAFPARSVTAAAKVGLLNKCTAWVEKEGKKKCQKSITTTRHEAGLIDIDGGKHRFAITILTTGNASRKTVVEALSKSLAELIVERNP